MITVAPSAEFETSIDWGVTGLTDTLRVSLLDGNGNVTTAATTTGIAEFPAGSGRYEVTLTAPGTAGQYSVLWDNGTQTPGNIAAGDDLLVTGATATVGGAGTLYVTRAELKTELGISVTTYDDRIDIIIGAVSRAIDSIKNTRYYTTSETRYYTASSPYCDLEIDDLTTLTTLSLDFTGDGTYETSWTNGTEFTLEPINNPLENKPYRTISLRPQSGSYFSCYRNAIKVVGSFGWSAIPVLISQAALMLAMRIYSRKDAPFGAMALGGLDTGTVVRIGRSDPDVMFLLEQVDQRSRRLIA